MTSYHVRPVRNYDGLWDSWAWGLYVDGELADVFGTEREAWDRADHLDGYDAEEVALAIEDEQARQEASWQIQDRERQR